jgi:hypothetical protein
MSGAVAMVIWKVEGSQGNFMSWTINGVNDHGSVTVYAVRSAPASDWVLQCELPEWDSRDEECRQNVQVWAAMNAVAIDNCGVARLKVANKGTAMADERHLARMATLLASTILSATFVRKRMGMARDDLAEAA